jgi:lactate permease
VHLPAAGLLEREVHLAPEPLQQPHHRTSGLREQGVVEAGDEEGDAHAGYRFPFLRALSGANPQLAAAHSTGGVLGKMISPQNLAIGAAAVGLAGSEGDLFRKVLGWSLVLIVAMCALVYLQSTVVLDWMVVK